MINILKNHKKFKILYVNHALQSANENQNCDFGGKVYICEKKNLVDVSTTFA